ncbi:uncharacterized protein BDZ99DRAFT_467628 [Mytilinidion resinicola]|uniref:UBC core domain-containing protein n=1 Tax=Mytilinidion resinicola TaxID=574789 RepID=A0A6A6Y695_9PEZI|nr:uncharacterized protein BDZ99DRAFT_467628 [Mytilinidion resinicola]KAF2804346.1 hypothetical protein BDZ99DRAFT_467628 [Mytilinidion resinicola]
MAQPSLHQRLLRDIAELQKEPYTHFSTHINDKDLTKICLILKPEGSRALHLTVEIPPDYPLIAPRVSMQSLVVHPNVFREYICASILNTEEGWTPAYTLKAICIQLLSFFSGGTIEQEYGGRVDLKDYQAQAEYNMRRWGVENKSTKHKCDECGFGKSRPVDSSVADQLASLTLSSGRPRAKASNDKAKKTRNRLLELPIELLLQVVEGLDTEALLKLSKTFPEVKAVLESNDCIRLRELQCFTLRESFMDAKLGVGVAILHQGKEGKFASEFELLSREAFVKYKIRKSIHGVAFDHWLPLPIHRRHWHAVKLDVNATLELLSRKATLSKVFPEYVLYHFMNNIVVQFSQDAESVSRKSTLNHASEKAVEAYFALFHLLLCLATENQQIIRDANRMIDGFLGGATSKDKFPNLGLLLVAALISDQGLTKELSLAVIKEAALRNVVWMLDRKGAGRAELAYIEPESSSNYRLDKTFEASTTSYRLLMFLNLFYKTARKSGKLEDLREQMFDNHGAPPQGTAERMAKQIREIREVKNFPTFLTNMGLATPTKDGFVGFLKRTITDSVAAGYSSEPLTQSQLYAMRCQVEPGIGLAPGVAPSVGAPSPLTMMTVSFFPGRQKSNGPRNGQRGRR